MITQPLWGFLAKIEYTCAHKLVAVSKSIAEEAANYYRINKDKFVIILMVLLL